MPTSLRPCCAKFPCGERALAGSRYCAAHKPSTSDHRQRDPEKYRIYHSARWKALRKLILGRQPVCQICHEHASHSVDHVVAVEDGGSKWATDNLQALCQRCHNAKSQQERRARASGNTPPSSTPGPAPADETPAPKRVRTIRAI